MDAFLRLNRRKTMIPTDKLISARDQLAQTVQELDALLALETIRSKDRSVRK